jgi:hypothetical protein
MAKDTDPKRDNTDESDDEATQAKSGRVAFDDRGCSTWEWRLDTGTFSRDIDTHRLRQHQEEAAVTLKEEEPAAPRVGVNPYSVTTPVAPQKAPRRTLDDMRKLSEEIKRKRQLK